MSKHRARARIHQALNRLSEFALRDRRDAGGAVTERCESIHEGLGLYSERRTWELLLADRLAEHLQSQGHPYRMDSLPRPIRHLAPMLEPYRAAGLAA